MSFRPVLLAALLVLGACKKDNPAYCEGDPDCGAGVSCDVVTHTCMTPDAGAPDARVDCTADEQCDGFCDDGTSLCAPCTNANDCGARTDGRNQCADGVCVQCVTSNDCGLELPICENNSCRACTMDET